MVNYKSLQITAATLHLNTTVQQCQDSKQRLATLQQDTQAHTHHDQQVMAQAHAHYNDVVATTTTTDTTDTTNTTTTTTTPKQQAQAHLDALVTQQLANDAHRIYRLKQVAQDHALHLHAVKQAKVFVRRLAEGASEVDVMAAKASLVRGRGGSWW